MVGRNFFKKFLVVGEKQLLSELEPLFTLGLNADSEIKKMLASAGGDMDGTYERVKNMEKQADEISNNLHMEITHGAISSTLMGTLSDLVEKCDTIIDSDYFVVREIRRFLHAGNNTDEATVREVDDAYRTFSQMIDYHVEALEILQKMAIAGNINSMRGERRSIEDKEERVDNLKDDLIDRLYRDSRKLPYLTFLHLMEMVHKLDDLLDLCEDISDLILNIANTISV